MIDFVKVFFSKSWEFFSIKWPGFDFSIGTVFLALAAAVGALAMICNMVGIHAPSGVGEVLSSASSKKKTVAGFGAAYDGGNNRRIKISKERKNDRK